jgi:hypothetical protein
VRYPSTGRAPDFVHTTAALLDDTPALTHLGVFCCIMFRARATERAAEKRKAADQGGPDAKIPRSATPAGAESSAANTPARTPTPPQARQQQQQQPGGDVLAMLLPGGIARSADPTSDVQRVLEVLVGHQEHQAVEVR